MNILAIDTSLAAGSIAALVRSAGDMRMVERPLGATGEHARRLMPALVEAAAALGWGLAAADLVAVVRGPGSFTGLRVGVTTAKALCWATGARLVGVSGFEVVARRTAAALCGTPEMAVAFDAGRGDVHAAHVAPDDRSPTGWSVVAGVPLPAAAWLGSLPTHVCLTGPAVETLAAAARERGLMIAPREAWLPSAVEAAAIAVARAEAGLLDDPHTLLPDYSRPSYAEEKSAPSG
jgi:tRNA threonylcarbamoyladenosine biosynthesis protein TsaB